MDDNYQKLKTACLRISLLMEHQHIVPDLMEFANELYGADMQPPQDCSHPEYLRGASEALCLLITFLEQKGN